MLLVGGENIRKIFKTFFLVLLLFLAVKVKAKVYGVEYKPIENLDLKIEEVKKYKFYKENKIEAYFIEGENPSIFEKQTEYYDTDYSEWAELKPEMKNNREIRERTTFIYQKLRKIKNFYIEIFDDTESVLEFALYFKGLSASNSAFCSGCTDGYYMYTSDKKYDRAVKINKLILNFNEEFYPNDFLLKVKFAKENVKYRIIIYGENKDNDVLYEKEFTSDLLIHDYTIADFESKNAFEEEIIKHEEDKNMYLKKAYKEYSYKDRYFLYEYILKNYYPTYEVSLDGYIKDENDFIIEKKYLYLETAVVKDKIEINSENYDLADYIKTTLPFETASNIDISKNGNYKIKYIFANKTIEKEVQVKTNREYISSLENSINKKNDEIKEIISNKDEIIERLESNIKSKDEIISKKRVEKYVSKQTPLPIILITIGVMLIIICIIKSFKKNVDLKK